MTASLEDTLRTRAAAIGFDTVRITGASLPPQVGARLDEAVSEGFHATMDWLADTADRRRSPDAMWPQARSAIVLAMSYAPDIDPMQRLKRRSTGEKHSLSLESAIARVTEKA